MWDDPTMPEVKKLDSKRRVVFPDRFSPGDVFVEESVSGDRITFCLLRPTDVPLASVCERNGRLMISSPLSRDTIRDAIREERDSR